ncbi:MAG: N-acetylneuraminate synthase family protein [Candidatus Sungiibacteriota bacterium]|uniref:N-acetylneuraminate synthase family protein n=1 Tax=Candidatus Sungiibacteriota bacterium TaxID=2750080 RepID=A0A7T5RJQ4_9BACT|nr:MAG: N-acetylneuraminate synthase family protein [Candidatus Sungbacteria bacterium]
MNGQRRVKIGDRYVGYGEPVFVVAEIGINHNGNVETAKKLIDGAVEAGCDAVKFQKRTVDVVYTSEELARPRENPFGSTNGDLKRGLEFDKKQYDEIDKYCKAKSILWYASPWDEASVDFLEQYDPPCYKVASACNQDRELMAYIKSKGRPIVVSTGMSDEAATARMVNFLGEDNLVLLHCVSTYPANHEELHLATIPHLIKKYPRAFIGYSGHEVGAYPTLVAATLGACMVERHITLDRAMWGSDQAASLELTGLNRLMSEIRAVKAYLGEPKKAVLASEEPIQTKLRRKATLI